MVKAVGSWSLTFMLASLPAMAVAKGPSSHQLAGALASFYHSSYLKPISQVHCYDFAPDNPTEFYCSYLQRHRFGAWSRFKAIVTIDGRNWMILEPPSPVVRLRKRR